MSEAGFSIVEVPLADVAIGGPLRARFEAIHERGWLRHGIRRWLGLLDPAGGWPTLVLGAFDDALTGPDALCGAIVGVWAPRPIDRFDDLVETPGPTLAAGAPAVSATSRPAGGFWHFVAVTRDPASPHRVADPLLEAVLTFVVGCPGGAGARTLSPLGGLDAVWAAAGGAATERPSAAFVRRCLAELCDADGKGHFAITWLHPARGARLEAVLHDSRADERRSCGITLRFAYDLDPAGRAATAARWRAFLAARGEAVAAGNAEPGPIADRYWAAAALPPCFDATEWGAPSEREV